MDVNDLTVGATFVVTEPYLKISCSLGEAPFWEKEQRTLRFVDINKRQLHKVLPDEGPKSHCVVAELDIKIGHTADVEGQDGVIAFGGNAGFGIFYRSSGTYEYIAKFWEGDQNASRKEQVMRANDGGVDALGRYWIGVMNDPEIEAPGPVGVIFRLDPDLSLHKMLDGIAIPNGVTWSKDNRTFFLSDSPTRNIYVYDYDVNSGSISNKRVFFHVEEADGQPDGQALDEFGFLWSAIFGLGKVVRLSPAGEVVATITLPTRCVTCPVFVDDWIYVTSAEEEEPERFPDSVRYQGALFRCKVGVRGVDIRPFKMTR